MRWRAWFAASLGVSFGVLLAPVSPGAAAAALPAGADKVVHAALFVVLAWAGRRAFPGVRGWWLFGGLAAYGALTEVAQGVLPGRTPSVVDWLADAAGAGLALALDVRRGRLRRRGA